MSSTSTPPEYTPSEHTPSEHSHSADPSGYVTVRHRRNPPTVEERDPYENGEEVTSDAPTRLPTPAIPSLVLQSAHRGPRVRATARKSVPLPRRVTLAAPLMTEGETSRRRVQDETTQVVTGYPARQTQGMTPGEERRVQRMELELHNHRSRLDYQHYVLGNLTEVLESHNRQMATAMEATVTTRRVARMFHLCLLMMAFIIILMGLMYWRMIH